MLKKVLSGIFTIILLLLITILSLVLIIRNITSKDTINDMINIFATNDNKTINTEDITIAENMNETSVVDSILNEILDQTNIPNELINYIETKEVSDYLNNYIDQYFQYSINMAEMPIFNTPEFNELINEGVKEYEKATGNKIEKEELDNIISSIDKNVAKVELPSNKYTNKVKQIIRVCFDNRTIYILVAIIIIINIIIAILVGIISMIRRTSIILVVNSLLLFGLSLGLTFLEYNEVINSIIKITIKSTNTLANISFGIGASLYILLIFITPKLLINTPSNSIKN